MKVVAPCATRSETNGSAFSAADRPSRYQGAALRAFLAELPRALAGHRSRGVRALGFQYGDVPDDLLTRVPRWIRDAHLAEGEEIRPGRVYRYGRLLVKLYPGGHSPKDYLRRSPAIRNAEWHAKLLPIRTPRPLLAIEVRSYGALSSALLITEFVPGPSLDQVWREDHAAVQEALAAFPRFMAQMHQQGTHHGDFHPMNLIWGSGEWVLIDLDSLRPYQPLRGRVVERQWARTLWFLDCDRRLRPYFDAYLRIAQPTWDPEDSWQRLVRIAKAADEARRVHHRYRW